MERVDLLTLKQEKSDFVGNAIGNGIADFVFSVQWEKEIGYITLLLEHQSTPDPLMAFRMQKYMLSICEAHIRREHKAKLPCIYPMILYSGKTSYTSPRSLWELFAEPKLAEQCFMDPVYVLEFKNIKDIDLRNRYHSGVVLSLMRAIHERDIYPSLYELQPIIRVLAKENKLHLLEYMLGYILDNGESENVEAVVQVFAESLSDQDKCKIMTIGDRLIEKGRQEGLQEGIKRANLETAKNMLANNIGLDLISKITKLPPEAIERLQIEV